MGQPWVPDGRRSAYLGHLSESGLQQGQEDAGDADVVPGLRQARVLPVHSHADGAGKVAHRHLVGLRGDTKRGLGTTWHRGGALSPSPSRRRLDRTEAQGCVTSGGDTTDPEVGGVGRRTVPLHPTSGWGRDWGPFWDSPTRDAEATAAPDAPREVTARAVPPPRRGQSVPRGERGWGGGPSCCGWGSRGCPGGGGSCPVSPPTHVLLHLQLLELHELGTAALQVEPSPRAVGLALAAGAHQQRHEGGRLDLGRGGNGGVWGGQPGPPFSLPTPRGCGGTARTPLFPLQGVFRPHFTGW